MANEVYANGRELSCKSGQGKSVLRLSRCLLHSAPDSCHPAGRAYPLSKHRNDHRHHRRKQNSHD